MLKKLILSGLAVMASAFLSTGTVQAQTLFQGNTFGPAGGTFTSTGTNVNQGLSFAGNDFTVTTAPLAGQQVAGVGSVLSTVNNLGLFTLDALTPTTILPGETFNLAVTFTVPTITTPGGNPATFTAAVTGTVVPILDPLDPSFPAAGGAFVVNFANTSPQPIAFVTAGGQQGTFTLSVNNLSITPGSTVPVTGTITANYVPEPGSLALLLPGLLPVGLALRRRKLS